MPDEAARRVVLRTTRLTLTSWLQADVDALLELHSDPEVMRFVRHGRPETREETQELVRRYRAEEAAQGWTKWRLVDQHGALVGRAGFGGDDRVRGLAYALRRSHWGRGLATEVADALVDWHLAHAPAARLRGLVEVGNDASARILEKVGFDEVGVELLDGRPCRVFHLRRPAGQEG